MVQQLSSFPVRDAPVRRLEGETLTVPASNGTRDAYNVRPDCQELLIEPVAAMRLQLVPAIKEILYFDASADRYRDVLALWPNFFDRGQAEVFTVEGQWATADYLYIGVVGIIGGIVVDVGGTVNAETSTLAAQYNAGKTWTTLTIASDGTDPAGGAVVTLGQDGLVTFTLPTNWSKAFLHDLVSGAPRTKVPLYWMRLSVSAALTAAIILANLTPIGRIAPGTDDTAARTGGVFLKANVEYTLDVHPDIGSVEIIAQAAAATTARASWVAR